MINKSNKKGQMGLAIIAALFCLVVGLMAVNLLMPEITQFRVDMNCANANEIHDGTKLLCLMGDLTISYWIIIIFSLVVGGITYKLSL